MPALNQRGPMGEGPMTGRKMGRCTNYGTALKNQEVPQDQNQTVRQLISRAGDLAGELVRELAGEEEWEEEVAVWAV